MERDGKGGGGRVMELGEFARAAVPGRNLFRHRGRAHTWLGFVEGPGGAPAACACYNLETSRHVCLGLRARVECAEFSAKRHRIK